MDSIAPIIRGQGRVLVFLSAQPMVIGVRKAIVAFHLDYPETTLEILLPLVQAGEVPVVSLPRLAPAAAVN